MKIRHGFVSNSSSSSFIVYKKNLSPFQINAIHNHIDVYNIFKKHSEELSRELSEYGDHDINKYDYYSRFSDCADKDNEWTISETDETIIGSTWMDNFDIEHLFILIGLSGSDYTFK